MDRPISRATSTWGVLRSVWAVCKRLDAEGCERGASIEEIRDHDLTLRDEPIDYRTVATHLRTLASKGLVSSSKGTDRSDRKLYYRPVLEELELVRSEIQFFLAHIIHGDPALLDELVRQLIEERELLDSGKAQGS